VTRQNRTDDGLGSGGVAFPLHRQGLGGGREQRSRLLGRACVERVAPTGLLLTTWAAPQCIHSKAANVPRLSFLCCCHECYYDYHVMIIAPETRPGKAGGGLCGAVTVDVSQKKKGMRRWHGMVWAGQARRGEER
jgi:hypothetical protein